MWPVGQMRAHVPQPTHASGRSWNGGAISFEVPRLTALMALAPTAAHARVHR